MVLYRFHNNKVYCRVSRTANLEEHKPRHLHVSVDHKVFRDLYPTRKLASQIISKRICVRSVHQAEMKVPPLKDTCTQWQCQWTVSTHAAKDLTKSPDLGCSKQASFVGLRTSQGYLLCWFITCNCILPHKRLGTKESKTPLQHSKISLPQEKVVETD